MPYRDDRQALSLQVAELERENDELREEVAKLEAEAKRQRNEDRNKRKSGALKRCVMCGGSVLPVAVFAGSEGKPIGLAMSTLRFGNPKGGFTGSAPIKALVCSSCGFIHHFIDISAPEAGAVTDDLDAMRQRAEQSDSGMAVPSSDESHPGSSLEEE